MMMISDVIRVFQVKTGILHIVIPGARIVMIVVMKLTAPMIVPNPESPIPKTHMFAPTPGVYVAVDNGV
jgi:hypothetical protein